MIYFIILFFSGFYSYANISENRINEIRNKVSLLNSENLFTSVQVSHDLKLNSPAGAYYLGRNKFKISINDKIFLTLSKEAQDLIIFHELGHIYLGHTQMLFKDRKTVEIEADYFASFLYKKLGLINNNLEIFINLISKMASTVPSGQERAEIFRGIIYN